jgi:AraC-like DNA-binding protein
MGNRLLYAPFIESWSTAVGNSRTTATLPTLASLPIGNGRAHFGTHVRELEMRARALFPQIHALTPLIEGEYFPHLSSFASLGGITLGAVSHLPCRLEISAGPTSMLVIPYSGGGRWTVEGREVSTSASRSALLISPAGGVGFTEGASAGLYLSIDAARLRRVGLAMSGGAAVDFDLGNSRELNLRLNDTVSLQAGLEIVVGQIAAALENPGLVPMLQLEDLFHRFAALLLAPGDFLPKIPARYITPPRVELDAICDRIRSTPYTPVNLSELEERSGYARATLIEAFRRRFSCTPVQWIRRERLSRAFEEIRDSRDPARIDGIAESLGFLNRSGFDRLFRHNFGIGPLEILDTPAGRMH